MLEALIADLRASLGISFKQDIQVAAQALGQWAKNTQAEELIRLGDDCAAIPEVDGYLLFAAEGMWPLLVETEPWFAGWCSVLVNVSDIYAMGGRPIAVVDALWSQSAKQAEEVWTGMMAASNAFNVPIVGGHTNGHSPYDALAVSILGRAKSLITSFNAQPGDTLLLVTNLQGKPHPHHPFWDAATDADPKRLQGDLALLPQLAEAGLCDAGKDVSMGGIVGTTLMLLEASGCGAVLHLDQVPQPSTVSLTQWLLSFPSYGFLLAVRPEYVNAIQPYFAQRDLVCAAIGHIEPNSQLRLTYQGDSQIFWNLATHGLTGFRALS
ncbi:MAG: sll0787 family AIR synthase-like protein [Cyanobacteria bacterium P01_F01_bin.150]